MIPADPERLSIRSDAARPTDFVGFRQHGIDLMLLGRYDEALDHLDRALELADSDPRRISVWINLGDVYRYRGDLPTAETLYRRTVDHARGRAPEMMSFALQHLGKALAEDGRLPQARALLTEALKLRVDEGDGELIESTRTALDQLDELTVPLPPMVAALLGDEPVWSDEHEGMSGGVAFVNGEYWIKRGPKAAAEHARLNWLRDRGIRLPDVVVFEDDVLVLADAGVAGPAAGDVPDRAPELGAPSDDPDRAPAAGLDAPNLAHAGASNSPPSDMPSIGSIMGALLRRLHDIPITDCPFDGRLDVTLAQARRQVLEGLVDPADFDDDNPLDPGQVLAKLIAERPEETDLVVAHGDFTPSNVLADGTLIDVGALGVADRYRDLALAERDLAEDFGAGEVRAFRTAYGLTELDRRRMDYYRLLDELS